jgi:branched-chain amino acid aminotransferase
MIAAFKSAVNLGSLDMPSVYEVLRVTDGSPVFLQEHYDRLEKSLAAMGRVPEFSCEELRECIAGLVSESGIRDHNIKIEADVEGFSRLYLSPTHYPEPELYETGVKTDLFRGERRSPNIKMMDRQLREATDEAIKAGGLYEVLLVDKNGQITEGSRSNVFFIKDREVYTAPAEKVLLGVTRSKIMEIIQSMGIALHEEAVSAADIDRFDAAFISGTSPKVMPIASIGEESFDVNDPILRKIMEKYDEY